jgi:hypothetical protein
MECDLIINFSFCPNFYIPKRFAKFIFRLVKSNEENDNNSSNNTKENSSYFTAKINF